MGDKGSIVIYRGVKGGLRLDVKLENDTAWLTQQQMAELFNKGRSTITEHVGNVFREKELDEKSVCRKFRHTAADGKSYETEYYNLDVVISVGYRVKSKEGTKFRIWATQVLKEHLINGFSVNNDRLKELQATFENQKETYMNLRFFLNKFLGSVARKDVVDTLIERVDTLCQNMQQVQSLIKRLEKRK